MLLSISGVHMKRRIEGIEKMFRDKLNCELMRDTPDFTNVVQFLITDIFLCDTILVFFPVQSLKTRK